VANAESSRPGEFTPEDDAVIAGAVEAIKEKMKVGCTGCGYCMPCPKGVDIPGSFAANNKCFTDGKRKAFKEYLQCTLLRKDFTSASNCIGCGKCEVHCPQQIEIRNELKNVKKKLEGPVYKTAKFVVKKFMKY